MAAPDDSEREALLGVLADGADLEALIARAGSPAVAPDENGGDVHVVVAGGAHAVPDGDPRHGGLAVTAVPAHAAYDVSGDGGPFLIGEAAIAAGVTEAQVPDVSISAEEFAIRVTDLAGYAGAVQTPGQVELPGQRLTFLGVEFPAHRDGHPGPGRDDVLLRVLIAGARPHEVAHQATGVSASGDFADHLWRSMAVMWRLS
jgi:hypothetical protein